MNDTVDLLRQTYIDLCEAQMALMLLTDAVTRGEIPTSEAWNAVDESFDTAIERFRAARAGAPRQGSRNGLSPRFAGVSSASKPIPPTSPSPWKPGANDEL